MSAYSQIVGRPQSINREQILEAAREIFLRDGVKASTATIARAAGVSEGSIFKRFSTKEALFREALGLPDVRIGEELGQLLSEGPIETALENVVLRLVAMFRELLPRMMMLWAHNAGQGRDPFEALRCVAGEQPMPLVILRALSAHLETQQREGRLREVDPEIIARVLIGSTHNFAFYEVIGIHERQPMAATSFARSVVDLVLGGAAPTPRGEHE